MLNASLHKSIVHRHLRRGCNIQSGQSCFDLGYSNYNLTRITWAWVLGITWGLGCKFRCGGDSDGVCDNNANRRPRFSSACFVGEFCEELKWRSSSTRRIHSLLELQRERRDTAESSGTWVGVGDSPGNTRDLFRFTRGKEPLKHTGPVPVHPWQRAWYVARMVLHTWASLDPGQVFFLSFGSLKPRHWDLEPKLVWVLNWSGLRTR
jgi:hypothetical protein